jgi:hypothetical protein
LWSIAHGASLVFAVLAGVATTLAAASGLRSRARDREARGMLEEAWERVAAEVLCTRGNELTAAELARATRTDEGHAEALLSALSARGALRVDVRDDAELAYRVPESEPQALDAEPHEERVPGARTRAP